MRSGFLFMVLVCAFSVLLNGGVGQHLPGQHQLGLHLTGQHLVGHHLIDQQAAGPSMAAWADTTQATNGRFTVTRLNTVTRPMRGPFEYGEPEGVFPVHSIRHWFRARTYHAYDGRRSGDDRQRPVILLLHGSGRTGISMLDMWRRVADANSLILIAPDSSSRRGWSSFADSSGFLNGVLDDAGAHYDIDRDQMFLFGHSAGAIYATLLAEENPLGARAIGAHAGYGAADYEASTEPRVPIAFFLGEHDQLFSVDRARQAGQALAAGGHDVILSILPNHGHWYYGDGPAINRDAWSFFARHR